MDTISMDHQPFDEGASRWTYRGKVMITKFGFMPRGSDVVIKVLKPEFINNGVKLSEADVQAQQLTRLYADKFNDLHKPSAPIFVATAEFVENDKNRCSGTKRMDKGDNLWMEQFVHGHYEKFNSNTGWSSGKHSTPDAFSHWTWVKSRGKHLVCDLQGHRGYENDDNSPSYSGHDNYYLLNDAVVMTPEGNRYGCSDCGKDAIMAWLDHHECGPMCHSLGIAGKKPIHTASASSIPCQRRTMYRCEVMNT